MTPALVNCPPQWRGDWRAFLCRVRAEASPLAEEMRAYTSGITMSHWSAFERLGIAPAALTARAGIGVVNAVSHDGQWEPREDGTAHIVMPVIERGEVVDLCAFRPATPREYALRTGLGSAIGFDDIEAAATAWADDEPLALVETPLDTLRVGGACVLRWTPDIVAALLACDQIAAVPALAATIRTELTRPPRLPRIIMPAAPAKNLEAARACG